MISENDLMITSIYNYFSLIFIAVAVRYVYHYLLVLNIYMFDWIESVLFVYWVHSEELVVMGIIMIYIFYVACFILGSKKKEETVKRKKRSAL